MKLGVQLNSFDWTGGPERLATTLAEIARTAEEAGFDRIGVADHVWQHPIMGGPEANEPECYTMLSFIAANTTRIKLTAMVSGVHFLARQERAQAARIEEEMRLLHPIGRVGRPEKVASAVAYLLSDDATFINGAILPVGGGRSALGRDPEQA